MYSDKSIQEITICNLHSRSLGSFTDWLSVPGVFNAGVSNRDCKSNLPRKTYARSGSRARSARHPGVETLMNLVEIHAKTRTMQHLNDSLVPVSQGLPVRGS